MEREVFFAVTAVSLKGGSGSCGGMNVYNGAVQREEIRE
jgi:uncharacterized protein YbbK (DUF523 family)